MPIVITITGPSAAGKSTIARFLLGYGDDTFRPQLVPKYTTRPKRLDDSGEVICVDAIPAQCDLVYEHYEHLYGLESGTLVDALAAGFSPIVILNDVNTVKTVREALPARVRSLFVFREEPSLDRYQDFARAVGLADEKEPVRRFLYAQAFYQVYSQNMYLFDHVIVNGGSFSDLDVQVRELTATLRVAQDVPAPKHDNALRQRFFVIVASLGSAKEGLTMAIDSLGGHQAQVIPGSAVYGAGGEEECLRSSHVLEVLRQGVFPVLIVDDVDAIGRLWETFGELVVLLYVHSQGYAEAYQHSRLRRGVERVTVEPGIVRYREAFDVYLDCFLAFDHVIIDADSPVYLLDQLFWLFRAYERGDLPRTASRPQIEIPGCAAARPSRSVGSVHTCQSSLSLQGLAPGVTQASC